jgi:glutathione synthase/RimK-type ligase-like ATP-grasp enzyme
VFAVGYEAAQRIRDLPPEETRDICLRAARTIGLDVAGIDIVREEKTSPSARWPCGCKK